MSHLQTIKHRKQAVLSSQKITNAMKMISASRMHKLSPLQEAARRYKNEWDIVIQEICSHYQNDKSLTLLYGNPQSDKTLFIVCGSNRGLCGSFNATLGKYLKETIQGCKEFADVECWAFGLKLDAYLDSADVHISVMKRSTDLPQIPDIRFYARNLVQKLKDNEYKDVFVIYTNCESFLSLTPTTLSLVPLVANSCNEEVLYNTRYSFEPPIQFWLEDIIAEYYTAVLYSAFTSQSLSEQIARMQAMDTATQNAESMIYKLTLLYNRSRQETITKELMEIVASAESMKDKVHAH